MKLKELKQLVNTNEEFSIPTAEQERKWVISGEISKLVNHSYHRIVKILDNNEYDKWREEDIISDLIILLYEYAANFSYQLPSYKTWIELKLLRNYNLKSVVEENLNAYKEVFVDKKYDGMMNRFMNYDELERYIKEVKLTDREIKVLIHRFIYGHTPIETGNIFGITSQRIQQIEAKALRKIRRKANQYRHSEEARIRKILEARQKYEYESSKKIEKIRHLKSIEFNLRSAISSAELEFEGEYQIWNHEVLCRHINSIFRKLFIDFEVTMFNPYPKKEINPGSIVLVFNSFNINLNLKNRNDIYQAVNRYCYDVSRTSDSYLILDHFKMDYDQFLDLGIINKVITHYFTIANISLETEELFDGKREYTIKIYKVKKG